MEVQEYFVQRKNIHNAILSFIDSEQNNDDNFQFFVNIFERQKIGDNGNELEKLICLILNICKNHHRQPNFYNKIDQFFISLKGSMKQTLSNSQIFNACKGNKRILLFLIKNHMITLNKFIINYLLKSDNCHFFSTEIIPMIDDEQKEKIEHELSLLDPQILEHFEEKRFKGENDSYICEMIQKDSIEEFVTYVNQTNLSLFKEIKSSIYETNSFLINKSPTLIEYAAFFGSIQIIQFLRFNNIEFTPSLWLYAIHSNNAELIHLLEENKIHPEDETYYECFVESIKCHHNEIANYILNNYCQNIDVKRIYELCFRYVNYAFIPDDFNVLYVFLFSCKYNFYELVDLLLKNDSFDINEKIIPHQKKF